MSSYDDFGCQKDGICYVLTTEDEPLLTDESVDEEHAIDSIDAIAAYKINTPTGYVLHDPGKNGFPLGEDGLLEYLEKITTDEDDVTTDSQGDLIDFKLSFKDPIDINEELSRPDPIYNELKKRAANAARKRDE